MFYPEHIPGARTRLGSRAFIASFGVVMSVLAVLFVVREDLQAFDNDSVAESLEGGYATGSFSAMDSMSMPTMPMATEPGMPYGSQVAGSPMMEDEDGLEDSIQSVNNNIASPEATPMMDNAALALPSTGGLPAVEGMQTQFDPQALPNDMGSAMGSMGATDVDATAAMGYPMAMESTAVQPDAQAMPNMGTPKMVMDQGALYTPAEANALSGQNTASAAQELNTLENSGAAAAFHQAEVDAKAHLSIAAAKRAEALAKVMATEKASVPPQGVHYAQLKQTLKAKARSDARVSELSQKVNRYRHDSMTKTNEERQMQVKLAKENNQLESTSAKEATLEAETSTYQKRLADLETQIKAEQNAKLKAQNNAKQATQAAQQAVMDAKQAVTSVKVQSKAQARAIEFVHSVKPTRLR